MAGCPPAADRPYVMRSRVDPNFVSAWIAFKKSESGTPDYDRHFWAFDRVCRMSDDAEQVWEFVLAVLAADQSMRVLAALAAGPLEHLLVDHPQMISRVEAEAAINPQFAFLLGGVWQNDMPDDVWCRVQAAASEGW